MLKREQELRQSPTAQRAYSLSLSSRWDITRQIQLRVVREFNLPDAVADVLQSASQYCAYREDDAVLRDKPEYIGVQGRKPGCYLRQRLAVPFCREPLPYVPNLDSYHVSEVIATFEHKTICHNLSLSLFCPLPSFLWK